ncbi:MAG: two-component system activity regulator YycH [Clostridia bacterium]|nr:two-component system activity regulator YycH [Clostridia bacterium]
MRRLKREKIKSVILLCLIFSSMVLIGIHWNQQAQGFPFRFLTQFLVQSDAYYELNTKDIEALYFNPQEIVVSSGQSSQWKLQEGNSDFKKIWKDVKDNYLPVICSKRPYKVLSKDQWGTILKERYVRLDFSSSWPSDIVFWLENYNPKDFQAFESIQSIAIFPQKDVNEAVNTVYVYDNNQVYQYQINIGELFVEKKYYKTLADNLSMQEPGLSVMSAAFPIFVDLSFRDRGQEILVALDSQKTKPFSVLKAEVPPEILLDKKNNESIQSHILLSQKDSLMAKYSDSEAIFSDTENYYKLHYNGLLEYNYLPKNQKDIGNPRDALSQVLSFIEPRKSLNGGVSLVMTGFEKADIGYWVKFCYAYKGTPIYMVDPGNSEGQLVAPLAIKANGDRVLEVRWLIRSIKEEQPPENYSIYFGNLIEKQIPALYPEILEKEPYQFRKLEPGYVLNGNAENATLLKPDWIIGTEAREYIIPLEKGEK